jgi:hypothetical protein
MRRSAFAHDSPDVVAAAHGDGERGYDPVLQKTVALVSRELGRIGYELAGTEK